MIHEKIVSKNKQQVESIESESSNAESSRSRRNDRRVSIISIEIFDDASEDARTFFHIRNMNQLKYWMQKDENVLIKTWVDIRDESIYAINEFNKKIDEMKNFEIEYNDRIDELNDVKLIIRELKVKLREKNLENTLLSIIEDEVVVSTFKKLSDSSIFTDDKDSIIDDWLSAMRNKMKDNANWFSTDVQQKAYVRIRIEDDVMKHLISRFFKNSIKSYIISKEIFDDLYQIFDDLYQIFDDSNRRTNALKTYRRLK